MAEGIVGEPTQTSGSLVPVEVEGQGEQDLEDTQPMERVMKKLGVLGRYQLIQIVIVCLSSTLFVFAMLNFVFIGYQPEHKCQVINETDLLERHNLLGDNTTQVKYGSCRITVTSRSTGQERENVSVDCYGGYSYTQGKDRSFVTDWDLVCDRRSVVALIQAMYTVGLAFGSVFTTSLADRYGRKYFYMLDVAGVILCELGLVFAPNIYMAITMRFFTGLAAGGMVVLHCVVAGEWVVTKYRQIFWAVDCLFWSLNVMLLSGIAYLFRNSDWRYLQLMTPLLGIHIFLASFAINETPVWYLAKGRYDDAKRVLRRACQRNGKNVDEILDTFQTCIRQAKRKIAILSQSHTTIKPKTSTMIDIVHNPYVLKIVIISCFTWFTNSLGYYGLFLTSSTLAGNRFLNFFLMGLLEIPSTLLFIPMVVYLGRRVVVFTFLSIAALSLLISTCLVAIKFENNHVANASTVFFLLGKFGVSSSFNVFTVHTQELMFTTIRSTGTGFCATFGRIGGIVAPFLLPLFQMVNWVPGAILTSLCLINLALLPLLPETKGRQLPNTIEEINQWKESKTKGNVDI